MAAGAELAGWCGMIRRIMEKQVRGLARTEPGRWRLAHMLDTPRKAAALLRGLIDSGVDTPDNLKELDTVAHDISVLETALGTVRA